jgi:hypothetical protein
MMRIALDFDGTVTLDILMWAGFVQSVNRCGHTICIVTMRTGPLEARDNDDIRKFMRMAGMVSRDSVIFTCGAPKSEHFKADVWIDDMPDSIPSRDSFIVSQALENIVAQRRLEAE